MIDKIQLPNFYRSSKMKNTIGIIILVFLLTGCATTKNFNSNDKGRIESISVTSEHVKFKSTKDIIFLNTDAKAWAGLLAGPIGALVYGSMDDHTPEAVTQVSDLA